MNSNNNSIEKNDNISVVIRSKNEEQWIGHTIQSVLDFIEKPDIIVVDNNSSDDTIKVVGHFKQDPNLNNLGENNYGNIKILNINNYTPGRALNLGVNNCSNNYILIISSHCVLKRFNIDKHKKDLEKHICVFGNQNPVWYGKRIVKRYIWSHFKNEEEVNMFSEMEERYFMHNALALYKKQTLLNNPFDEYLVGKEDRYWINNRIKEKSSFLYDPQMEVEHHYTNNGNTWKGIG